MSETPAETPATAAPATGVAAQGAAGPTASPAAAPEAAPGPRSRPGGPGEGGEGGPADRPKACPSCGARFAADALYCSLDGSPLTASPSVALAAAASDPYLGHEILGHIEIRQLVGIGAMGRVYRAFQRGIDRDVAVKVLHRELSANQALVARFEREAKVASRLAHPNVVHVLLVGQLPDGALYIVMEYLDGMSLQSALAAVDGAMPLPRALHVALQLCDAAGEGHSQGIVHRDLKPENVMLVRRADDADFVKVLDFGIARVHWGEHSMATAAGLIFGTARYISPEGAQGEQVGPAGDVYSIATMLYQMLSGRTPFQAEQAVALLVQQIHDAPLPLRSVSRAAYVPEPIGAVIMQNLAKKPAERAADARAFGRQLLEAAVSSGLSAQDVLARPSLRGGGRGSHPSAVQMPALQRTRQLQLEPETAARIGAVTALETPADEVAPASQEAAGRAPTRTEIADPTAVPPGMATTKWVAPPRLATKLVEPPVVPARADAPASRPVDQTMDEGSPARTRPLATAVLPPSAPPASPARPGAQPPRSSSFDADTTPPIMRASRVSPPGKPVSSVDATMAGEEMSPVASLRTPPKPGAQQARRGAAAAALGLLSGAGAVALAVLAWKSGMLAGHHAAPADNGKPPVVDSRGANPKPPGVGVPEAPNAELAPLDPAEPPQSAVPPLSDLAPTVKAGSPAPASPATSAPAAAGAGAPRITVEATNSKPGIGQPVDFLARVTPAAKGARIDAPRFSIAGPGLASGTVLQASDEGAGVFRTTFTFLEGGRFEVAFSARADGAPLRATRVVQVGEPGAAPALPPPAAVTSAPAAVSPPAAAPPASPATNATANGSPGAEWL